MKKIFKGTGLAIMLTLILLTVSEARTAYVSDMLILTFREGPGPQYNVLKSLKSNTPLNVLEENQGYYKVALESGEQGWVDMQFVMFDPPNALLVTQLQKEKADLETQLATLTQASNQLRQDRDADQTKGNDKLAVLEDQLRRMVQENKDLARQLQGSRDEMAAFKAASADIVSTMETSKALAAENQRLSQELSAMETQNTQLFRTGMIKWFLSGVGVLLLGWLIGLMLSSRRRRNSLLD